MYEICIYSRVILEPTTFAGTLFPFFQRLCRKHFRRKGLIPRRRNLSRKTVSAKCGWLHMKILLSSSIFFAFAVSRTNFYSLAKRKFWHFAKKCRTWNQNFSFPQTSTRVSIFHKLYIETRKNCFLLPLLNSLLNTLKEIN
jgi:hypothetical protein